jgi:hypothetical protein
VFSSNQCALVICALYIRMLKVGTLRAQNPCRSYELVPLANQGGHHDQVVTSQFFLPRRSKIVESCSKSSGDSA